MEIATFSESAYERICNQLASQDADLKSVLDRYGYPPFWSRPNSFESLVHIILEQQVSLASALAALEKLRERVVSITPEEILALSIEELRTCFVSRQKASYLHALAYAVIEGQIDLIRFERTPDADVRRALVALKGIGNWTVDVYLIFVLKRADIFPVGDLAAVKSLKRVKQLNPGVTEEEMLELVERWRPHRSIATMLLWHNYLSLRRKGL